MITPELSAAIREQVAIHTRFILDFEWSQDYRFVRMLNEKTGKMHLPASWKRRTNDILGAAYMHAIAFDHGNGDDCMDEYGNRYEVKLTYINSDDVTTGPRGGLLHNNNSLAAACRAKFSVYDGTHDEHHNQTTAYVLMSEDHNCFITGYIMTGRMVSDLLIGDGNRKSTERGISLSQFQNYGYEFSSMISHIGWDVYEPALYDYVMARDGKVPADEAAQAIQKWINLVDHRKLRRL